MNIVKRMRFNKKIMIKDAVISEDSRTFIIAEAGVNHCGSMDIARKLVDIASEAGADAVKFQVFKTEALILKEVSKASYQLKVTPKRESQFDMLKKLEFTKEQNKELKMYCKKKKIMFLATPFDEYSLELLEDLDVWAYKVSSTDITNLMFLRKVAKKGKPIILSTGMSYMNEVKQALREIGQFNRNVILLQCTSDYPARDTEINLTVINEFKERFDMLVGFSDHSRSIGASPYAVAMGANVIEKHFTINKHLDGPDHKASLDPSELVSLIQEIRKVETYMGVPEKKPTSAELKTRASLQKCFVATRTIRTGEAFSVDNIVGKRTGGVGISPIDYGYIIKIRAKRNFDKDEIIEI